jgi:hypothetical protein
VTWRLRLQCDASLFLQYIQDSLVCCNLLVLRTNTYRWRSIICWDLLPWLPFGYLENRATNIPDLASAIMLSAISFGPKAICSITG